MPVFEPWVHAVYYVKMSIRTDVMHAANMFRRGQPIGIGQMKVKWGRVEQTNERSVDRLIVPSPYLSIYLLQVMSAHLYRAYLGSRLFELSKIIACHKTFPERWNMHTVQCQIVFFFEKRRPLSRQLGRTTCVGVTGSGGRGLIRPPICIYTQFYRQKVWDDMQLVHTY